jgi:hypothetical protein
MKEDPSICMEIRVKDSDMKIKDLSSIEGHKETKDIWFSSGFIVFSLWPYY